MAIFGRHFFWILLVPLALPAGGGARAEPARLTALEADRRCAGPITSSRTIHEREKVRYDLARQPAFRANRRGRMMGLFTVSAQIGYKAEIQESCVKRLKVRVTVRPSISLRKSLAKKANTCMRKITLDHEYGHARIARAHYKGLARRIEKMAGRIFHRKKVGDFATLNRHFQAGLKILLAGFNKKYAAAQEGLHAKLRRAEIVEKDCRLKKNRHRWR